MLRETLVQIDALSSELVQEFNSVRASRTMKNKYNALTNISENIGSLLSSKIAAIREINSSISKSNDLDYKKLKDLKAAQGAMDDDKYIAELSNIKMNPSFQNEKSTSGMTDEGKAKAKELKNKLVEQRKARQKQIADQVKDKIAQLRARYKINRNMTDEQKQMIRDKVAAEVQKLRDYAKAEKAKIKEEFDGMYQSGLNNLKQDRSLMRGVE
jgi:hypothetical protein